MRTRAQRLKRRAGTEPVGSDAIVDEALELCNNLLIELAGAETEIRTLRDALQQERQDATSLFERIPIASVSTDAAGTIKAANHHAALLLNVSARHLARKPLLHFTQDRVAFLALLQSLPRDGSTALGTLAMRPRERRTMPADVIVIPGTSTSPSEWLWFFTPRVAHDGFVERDRRNPPHRLERQEPGYEAESGDSMS